MAFPAIGSETIVCQRKVSCEGTVVASVAGGSNIGAFQQSGGGSLNTLHSEDCPWFWWHLGSQQSPGLPK